MLNRHLPSRVLSHKSPLEAYPQAIHSGRSYRPEWEEEFLSLEKVCTYLAQGRWFRGIRSNGCFDARQAIATILATTLLGVASPLALILTLRP